MQGYTEKMEVRRARLWNSAIFSVLLLLVITVGILLAVYLYQYSFSKAKWDTDTKHRYRMVSDLLHDYPLVGMSEAEVTGLLGEEQSDAPTSFKVSKNRFAAESTLVYYLGCDRMDDNWLIVSVEGGTVTGYCIDYT